MPTSSTATDNTISNTASGAPAALTDQLIMERGTTGYKLLVSDIAKAVVELYSGSSLAGASQSVKAALDSLNSSVYLFKGGVALTSNSDLNTETYCTLGTYYSNSMDISRTLQNCPVNTVFRMTVEDMSSGLSANYRYIRRTIISGTAQSNYTVYTQICYKSGSGQSFVFGDWVLSPTRSEINSLNSRTSAYLLSSSENLLTVVLDDTILPPSSQKLFDLRNANNTDLPEAGAVYGMAVAIKRTSGNCNVMIYGDAGTIWHNSHASNQSWKGWSEL